MYLSFITARVYDSEETLRKSTRRPYLACTRSQTALDKRVHVREDSNVHRFVETILQKNSMANQGKFPHSGMTDAQRVAYLQLRPYDAVRSIHVWVVFVSSGEKSEKLSSPTFTAGDSRQAQNGVRAFPESVVMDSAKG